MYSNSWDSSSKPPPANNPFLESSAANRFPALDSPQPSFQSTGASPYGSQSVSPSSQFAQSPYGMQQPQQQFGGWNGQPQQMQNQLMYNQGQGGFSGFSSPMQAQATGMGGYGQQYGQQNIYSPQFQSPAQPQYTGYPQFQQPAVSPPPQQQYQQSMISEFDPFGGSGGGSSTGSNGGAWNSTQQQGNFAQQYKTGPNGQQHPRAFIQSRKAELESWNPSVWNQAIIIFEDLKKAWENRRSELQRNLLAGQYLTAQDTANLQAVCSLIISNAMNFLYSVTDD